MHRRNGVCYSWRLSKRQRSRSMSLSAVLVSTATRHASVALASAWCSITVNVRTILMFWFSHRSNMRLAWGVPLSNSAWAAWSWRWHGRHRWPDWPSALHTGLVPSLKRKHLSVPCSSRASAMMLKRLLCPRRYDFVVMYTRTDAVFGIC